MTQPIDENKYNKSQIYILKSPHSNRFYIGSTIQGYQLRKLKHYYDYKGFHGITPKFRHYRTSFKIIDDGDYYVELLEDYKCDNKKDLLIRETEYIHYYKNKYGDRLVNKYLPNKINTDDLLFNNIVDCV